MCVRSSETFSRRDWEGPCALTAVLGGMAPFPDMPSKGPCCNSNIIAIRFEGLNCQERMMATTGHGAIKAEYAADCSWRFFFFYQLLWQSGPCYHAAAESACKIREKLNANGDGI